MSQRVHADRVNFHWSEPSTEHRVVRPSNECYIIHQFGWERVRARSCRARKIENEKLFRISFILLSKIYILITVLRSQFTHTSTEQSREHTEYTQFIRWWHSCTINILGELSDWTRPNSQSTHIRRISWNSMRFALSLSFSLEMWNVNKYGFRSCQRCIASRYIDTIFTAPQRQLLKPPTKINFHVNYFHEFI